MIENGGGRIVSQRPGAVGRYVAGKSDTQIKCGGGVDGFGAVSSSNDKRPINRQPSRPWGRLYSNNGRRVGVWPFRGGAAATCQSLAE